MWLGRFIAYFLKIIYGAGFYRNVYGDTAKVYFVKRVFPSNAVGQTWGDIIFIKKEYSHNEILLKHEYCHVLQWKRLGIWFLPAYIWASVVAFFKHGPKNLYNLNKYEVEAKYYAGFKK